MHRRAYALGRLKLHDEKRTRQLGSEFQRDGDKALKKLPYPLKIIFGVGELDKALVIRVARLCHDIVEYGALAVEHRVKHRARHAAVLAYFVDADVFIPACLEQLYRAVGYVLLEICHKNAPLKPFLLRIHFREFVRKSQSLLKLVFKTFAGFL